MRLAAAASRFDKVLCQDAYTPATQLYGQLDVFDDSRRDGVTVLRRVLSVAGGTAIPARRALTIHGEQWIVGTHESDSYKGEVIRDKFVLQRAHGACTIRTIDQALIGSGGVSAYGAKLWVKDMKEIEVSSKLSPFFHIYLSSYETVAVGSVISLLGREHIVRNTFLSAAGFLVAESDELVAGAIQAGTFYPRSYAPATDAITDGAPVALQVLRLRFQDEYEYLQAAAPKMEAGDIRVMIRKNVTAAPPKANDKLVLPDATWLVISVSDESSGWGLHLRRRPV